MKIEKDRHWFLTLWLVLLLLSNAYGLYSNVTGGSNLREAHPNAPGWAFLMFNLMGLIALVSVIALFMWKKWGFWAFGVASIVGFGVNLVIGLSLGFAALGFLAIGILFVALRIGGDMNGWSQLE